CARPGSSYRTYWYFDVW
nr:immunoglobulin heavy chain junction region [Mus musculus]